MAFLAHCVLVALLITALSPVTTLGQDLEPRAYTNVPVGINFLLGGYGYSGGGLATDPALPIRDANLNVHTALTAYARSFDVLGMSAKVDAILPYSWLSGDATFAGEPQERQVSGFNDPRFRFTLNFLGAPALSMQEFASYEQELIAGASVQISPPLGQYDSSKLVNLGTNRWFIKPELGISRRAGPLTLELAPSVTFYTNNDDFLGGMTREQEPLFAIQSHLVYSFERGIWGALDSTYFFGGRTEVDGIENDDRQENWRLGATLSVPIDRRRSIKIYGSTGVSTRTGSDFGAAGVLLQYRWGQGL